MQNASNDDSFVKRLSSFSILQHTHSALSRGPNGLNPPGLGSNPYWGNQSAASTCSPEMQAIAELGHRRADRCVDFACDGDSENGRAVAVIDSSDSQAVSQGCHSASLSEEEVPGRNGGKIKN
jgi:hypothetical protein